MYLTKGVNEGTVYEFYLAFAKHIDILGQDIR